MQNYSYVSTTKETLSSSDHPTVYADFWERLAAFLLDAVALVVSYLILTFLLPVNGPVFGTLLAWLYSAFQESGTARATLGKKAMGLQVTSLLGRRLTFGQATLRHFGKHLSSFLLCIGYLLMLTNEQKQTLHDKIARSLVVRR
ncbi:RDD family protein [Paraflavisolibacter sp. H34]|uniref:RDD family protein n=1 Tax=Huijunlia imazamoxiresistens TaxID=3127457 RepID=UPI00301881FD